MINCRLIKIAILFLLASAEVQKAVMNALHFATCSQQQIRALAVMSSIAQVCIQVFTEQSDTGPSNIQSDFWHAYKVIVCSL